MGRVVELQNDTCVSLGDIGTSPPHQLACITDRMPCCSTPQHGHWYYPNGTEITLKSESFGLTSVYVNWTDNGSVNLFRVGDIYDLHPTGSYCCRIADSTITIHTLCVNLGWYNVMLVNVKIKP